MRLGNWVTRFSIIVISLIFSILIFAIPNADAQYPIRDPVADRSLDSDRDGIPDHLDNCPTVANKDQKDTDGDGLGDVCDSTPNGDDDGDGVDNLKDNCRYNANKDQSDRDGDEIGDVCDKTPDGDIRAQPVPRVLDSDGDGIPDTSDNCPFKQNSDQQDSDQDGLGDVCDSTYPPAQKEPVKEITDTDRDGVEDYADNCPFNYNPDQKDSDKDGIGDVCDFVGQAQKSNQLFNMLSSVMKVQNEMSGIPRTILYGDSIAISGYESTSIIISGNVKLYERGVQLSLTITMPDGTQQNLGVLVSRSGDFTVTVLNLNQNSQPGTYSVSAEYGSETYSVISFNVETSDSSTNPPPSSDTSGTTDDGASNYDDALQDYYYDEDGSPKHFPHTSQDSMTAMFMKLNILEPEPTLKIPSYVKNVATFWEKDQIDDDSFVGAIGYMIETKIITIPDLEKTQKTTTTKKTVPDWVKTTTKFWTSGATSDREYADTIQYLIKIGVIDISPKIDSSYTHSNVEALVEKLKSLHEQIKDLQEQIRELVEQLKTLAEIYTQLVNQCIEEGSGNVCLPQPINKCIDGADAEACIDSLDHLAEMIQKITNEIVRLEAEIDEIEKRIQQTMQELSNELAKSTEADAKSNVLKLNALIEKVSLGLEASTTSLGQAVTSYGDMQSVDAGPAAEANFQKLQQKRAEMLMTVFDEAIDEAKSQYEEAKEELKKALQILLDHEEMMSSVTQKMTS